MLMKKKEAKRDRASDNAVFTLVIPNLDRR